MCCLHAVSAVPCTPAAVRADYTCATNMAALSWNESLGRESFIARIQTQDQSDSCSTNQTRCSLSSMLCGRLYNVSVGAVAGQCNSINVARTQMQTGKKMNALLTTNFQHSHQNFPPILYRHPVSYCLFQPHVLLRMCLSVCSVQIVQRQ